MSESELQLELHEDGAILTAPGAFILQLQFLGWPKWGLRCVATLIGEVVGWLSRGLFVCLFGWLFVCLFVGLVWFGLV